MQKIVQVVKRFGPVGGMERYVWELSHALAKSGTEVHIVCEQYRQSPSHDNIHIHTLGIIRPKPRWCSMLRFSHRVKVWVSNNANDNFVIHSHERTSVHHVTTFHSTLFANVRKKKWWKLVSIRILVWLYLEKRELCSVHVQVVLPNSDSIHDELKKLYPCIGNRLHKPAYPGTNPTHTSIYKKDTFKNEIIIFIGQEWQRKGLKKAIQIVREIKKNKPALEFWVLGPAPDEIQHLFADWQDGYQLLGWQDSSPYLPKANLLLHPATAEPYGMAIAEASSVGVPVVISSQCGIASQITKHSGQVINTESSLASWTKACIEELDRKMPVTNISKSWDDLAKQHVKIYEKIKHK